MAGTRPPTRPRILAAVLALLLPLPLMAQGEKGTSTAVVSSPATTHAPHAGLTCADCHTDKNQPPTPASDPASPVSRTNVDATCGRCHASELATFSASSHGKGLAAGEAFSPTCVSCHKVHAGGAVTNSALPGPAGKAAEACAECHEDPAVLRHLDLPWEAVQSYEASFHGIAHTHGITDVATCPSCHGAHNVLPPSNPASTVSPANVKRTCLKCHAAVTKDMLAAVKHPGRKQGIGSFLASLRIYFPVAGSAVSPLLISGMGALVGFLSGLFGVGGGFLMTPLLIFIGIPAAVAAATDAAQITAGATSGALTHSRMGNVDFKMGLVIVVGGWIGGYVGVHLVHFLRNLGNFDFFLKLVYVLVLGFIGSTMFMEGLRTWRGGGHGGEPGPSKLTHFFSRLPLQMHFPKSGLHTSVLLPAAAGFLVGLLAAFLGVGGGFIMLPAMIYVIGIPTRVAVGTDLFQIVLTSANVTLQQAITNHTVDILLAVTLFVGSVIGAQFGARASRYLKGEQIRVFLAVIVLIVMAILLFQLVTPPASLIDFAKSGGGH